MNTEILKIINSESSNKIKLDRLNWIIEDAKTAIDIVQGKYTKCPKCKDYYLAKSFITEEEIKEEKICTYNDPINSGGNEYTQGNVKYIKTICPKGHEVSVKRIEMGIK